VSRIPEYTAYKGQALSGTLSSQKRKCPGLVEKDLSYVAYLQDAVGVRHISIQDVVREIKSGKAPVKIRNVSIATICNQISHGNIPVEL
jgi:hypothetical protein